MDREKIVSIMMEPSIRGMFALLQSFLEDRGYSSDKITKALKYLYLSCTPGLTNMIFEGVVEHYRREFNICTVTRIDPEELLMVF